uniref:Putative extracellular cellulase CelA/allergen Asp F7-like protein n=1 Tax=Flammulina velutipes TaxID=38945 RepID=G8A550_FLAVE|nr:putative extracellular cellulase CelA/allergen Asp F7-like protein [Flammulina velutipes]
MRLNLLTGFLLLLSSTGVYSTGHRHSRKARAGLSSLTPYNKNVLRSSGPHNGKATYYNGDWQGGNCGFTDYDQGSFQGLAIGNSEYLGSAACGTCLRITGATGTADVMVVDRCPECDADHLDVFETVAPQIDADYQSKGVFEISWEEVPCSVSGGIQLKNKEGASGSYFAMQPRNTVHPVQSLEVFNGESWTWINREEYNFFVSYNGFGDNVSIRITSNTGETLTLENVAIGDGTIVYTSSQFSA